MIKYIYEKALKVLMKKPIKLWVLSIIYGALAGLASLGCAGAPFVGVALTSVLGVGMTKEYLDGYTGKEIGFNQLFVGFKNFWHVCGGMLWMSLWLFLWALIPVAGIVMAIIKGYSYRFMPYILINQPEVPIRDALKLSMEMADGYKGKMFGADILVFVACGIVSGILALLGAIPYVGIVFKIINVLFVIAQVLFLPLLLGIIQAAFYCEIKDPSGEFLGLKSAKAPKNSVACPACGAANAKGSTFCCACGVNLNVAQAQAEAEANAAAAPANAPEAPEARHCPNCGAEISEAVHFCPECGAKIE